MSTKQNDAMRIFSGVSRRDFLASAMAVGGSGFLLASMKVWGLDIASTQESPPLLQGSGKGKTVVILGA
ncbi:hypothetical protein, partial [Sulfuriferula sp.]|uniref:hypothetical protein n=1 Tax=Sulfuriferula sp. TaxID=2025307 RepID=UPI002790FB0B|nr:monoamine oxidase [Sulfuriferula sp.]